MPLTTLFQFHLFDALEAENFLVHVSIGLDVSIPEVKMEGELFFLKIPFNPEPGYSKLIFLDDGLDPIDLTINILGDDHHLLIPILPDYLFPSLQTDEGDESDCRNSKTEQVISCADT